VTIATRNGIVRLTSIEYWASHWRHHGNEFEHAFPLDAAIAPFISPGNARSLLEIGCAPGRILEHLCNNHQLVANGVDYAADPSEIEMKLKKRGVDVGRIYRQDIFDWKTDERYDVVCSFGFIEHFEEAAWVLDRHFQLCKPGGIVIVEFPDFTGFRYMAHWFLDRRNLLRHNTKIMNTAFLEAAASRNGAEILRLARVGGHFDLWVDDDASLIARRLVRTLVPPLRYVANRVLPGDSNRWFSPLLLAVYRNRK
jgi:2-polyprenyl-3-methyl-5-hydroxy-6-metoxy-1,4-benzoquinol methylase